MAARGNGFVVSKRGESGSGKQVFRSVSGGGGKITRVMSSDTFRRASEAANSVLREAGSGRPLPPNAPPKPR